MQPGAQPLHADAVGETGNPRAFKACPLPAAAGLGGQNATRENAPVNHSYGLQLALAWDAPASLSTRIPAAGSDVSQFKALTLGAAVNFFDPRNPARGTVGLWNPAATTQDFDIVLTDRAGHAGTVAAASPRYGSALHQTVGNVTTRVHVVLNSIRVPLATSPRRASTSRSCRSSSSSSAAPASRRPARSSSPTCASRSPSAGPTALRDQAAADAAAKLVEDTPRAAAGSVPDVVRVAATHAGEGRGRPLPDGHAEAGAPARAPPHAVGQRRGLRERAEDRHRAPVQAGGQELSLRAHRRHARQGVAVLERRRASPPAARAAGR